MSNIFERFEKAGHDALPVVGLSAKCADCSYEVTLVWLMVGGEDLPIEPCTNKTPFLALRRKIRKSYRALKWKLTFRAAVLMDKLGLLK